MFSKLFRKTKSARVEKPTATAKEADEAVVIVPIPPLVSVLQFKEADKGAALTEAEVLAIRDGAVCMTMRLSEARAMAQARGYDDLDPHNIWEAWRSFRASTI